MNNALPRSKESYFNAYNWKSILTSLFIKTLNESKREALEEIMLARINHSCGFKELTSLERMNLISERVRGSSLREITKFIPKKVVIEVLKLKPSDFQKVVRRKRLSVCETEALDDLTYTWRLLLEFFKWDRSLLDEWIQSPIELYQHYTPNQLLVTYIGRKMLRERINEMCFGDFA